MTELTAITDEIDGGSAWTTTCRPACADQGS
jgi:hypothetical protein